MTEDQEYDDCLLLMFRLDPICVPTTRLAQCMSMLGDPEDQKRLVRSVTRRRPRNDKERRILLHYALTKGVGGIAFVDALGGFEGQRVS